MISLKSPREIDIMARGGAILAATLERLSAEVRPGISTKALDTVKEIVGAQLKPITLPRADDYSGIASLIIAAESAHTSGIYAKRNIALVRGEGARVWDADGREYIDCVGGMARPGDRWWNWWGRLMEDFGAKLVAESFMSAHALRELEIGWSQVAREPGAFIYTPVLVQIVARRSG